MSDTPTRVRCLVCPPGPELASGLVTHIEREPVDVVLAQRQWVAYVTALEAHGWAAIPVPADDAAPDGVFVEDALVMLGELGVITRPGAPERRRETDTVAAALAALGIESVRLEAPARLDGGDVLKIGRTVYIGLGGRTDRAGIEAFDAIAAPRGYRTVAVPTTRVLHLKSAVTALPDGTVIGHAPLVDDPSIWPDFLEMPEPDGAHVVVLDDAKVLMSSSAPRSAELLEARGLQVVTVGIGEFEKLEGCVTCLSVRMR